jgi:hypothetical protein
MQLFYLSVLLLFGYSLNAQSEQIPILNKQQAQVLRDEIKSYLWGGEEAPVISEVNPANAVASFLENNASFGMTNVSSIEAFRVEMKYGFESNICLLHSANPNGKHIPIIYHSGHVLSPFEEDARVQNNGNPYSRSFLNFFLSEGYDIITIGMPMTNGNGFPDSVTEEGNTYPIAIHDDVFRLKKPYYYFLRPIKSIMDYLENRDGNHEFVMVGFSGGGWAADIYSAIDTRIRKSFGVASSIPVPLRLTWSNRGDKEQNYWDFYDRYNYTTFYYLASEGRGRLHMQVLNKFDNCCFAMDGTDLWVKDVNQKLSSNHQPGQYKFLFDTYSIWHCMSSVAMDSIYANLSDDDMTSMEILTERNPAKVRVYPNPAVNVINVEISSDPVSEFYYTISTIEGVRIQSGKHYDNYPINIERLARGMYVITIEAKTGKKAQQKFWVK